MDARAGVYIGFVNAKVFESEARSTQLTEGPAESRDDPPQDVDPVPMLSGVERVFVRLTLWQTVLSVAGVFIAIVALYAALTESAAVRQQTAATVWPFVQLLIEDYDTEASAGFTISLSNAGVGPARMRALRLIIDGEPIRDWEHAVTLLEGKITALMNINQSNSIILAPLSIMERRKFKCRIWTGIDAQIRDRKIIDIDPVSLHVRLHFLDGSCKQVPFCFRKIVLVNQDIGK